jgi:hypothetical protein
LSSEQGLARCARPCFFCHHSSCRRTYVKVFEASDGKISSQSQIARIAHVFYVFRLRLQQLSYSLRFMDVLLSPQAGVLIAQNFVKSRTMFYPPLMPFQRHPLDNRARSPIFDTHFSYDGVRRCVEFHVSNSGYDVDLQLLVLCPLRETGDSMWTLGKFDT